MSRAARTALAGEDGFTLVELLVTIVVGMIVLGAALDLLSSGFGSSARVQDRADAAGRARLTLDRATTLLQAQQCNGLVSPVTAATATSVTFTANTGDIAALPTQYRLWYEPGAPGQAGVLKESKYTMGLPDVNGYRAPGAAVDRVIADRVYPVGGASAPVFSYFGTDDSLDYEPLVDLADGSGAISVPANLKRVLNVRIRLRTLPTRTKTLDDKTSSVIEASAFVGSNLDPKNLDKGPQCTG